MNQSQVNNFLICLTKIDDSTYEGLHNDYNNKINEFHYHHVHNEMDNNSNNNGSGSNRNSSGSSNNNNDLLIAKATAMLVLFFATTICGLIPFLLNRYFKWTKNNNNSNAKSTLTVKCLLYFGGGVLLCTTFLHLLPEVQETIILLQECGQIPNYHFPLAQLLTCFGFFAMFLIEELIHSYIHHQTNQNDKHLTDDNLTVAAFKRGHSLRNSYIMKNNIIGGDTYKLNSEFTNCKNFNKNSSIAIETMSTISTPTSPISTPTSQPQSPSSINGGNITNTINGLSVKNLLSPDDIENEKYLIKNSSSLDSTKIRCHNEHEHDDLEKECYDYHHHHHQNGHHHNHHHHHHHHHNHHHQNSNHNHHSHHHHHQHHHQNQQQNGHNHSHLPLNNLSIDDSMTNITSSLRGLLIVLALSLHELFEGMAIGLESSANSVWFMFAAVVSHKLVLAFCVGVELIIARTRLTLSIIYILTFGIVSPIGIGIGLLISHQNDVTSANITSVILQGLATGTLLYVVFFEILSNERSGLIAYTAFFIGFVIMFALQQMGGHQHSHSHSCGEHGEHDHSEESLHTDHSHQHPDHNVHEDNSQMRKFEQQLKILREASKSVTEMLMKQNKNASIA